MNAEEIIIEYLKKNGFDGLWVDECGCEIDDLMPCGSYSGYCKPGKKTTNAYGEWMIGPREKP